jgi:hypothetical protein
MLMAISILGASETQSGFGNVSPEDGKDGEDL